MLHDRADIILLLPASGSGSYHRPTGQIAFVSGAAAAVGSGVVKVPIAVCIRSVQAGVYPDVVAAARSIVKAAGPRGLFTVSRAYGHNRHAPH